MSYKETLDELRKKYGISESGSETSEYKSGGRQQEDPYHATLSSLIEKYSRPPAGADRFSSMISDYNRFLEDTKKDYDTVDWGNSGELSEKNMSRISELGSTAKDLFQYYFTGEGSDEAFSAQNRGQLQEIMNNLRDMGSDWKNTVDYYRQWEDEDSWNEHKRITGLQEQYNWHTTPELETALEGMPAGEDKDYLSGLYDTLSIQQRYGGKADQERYREVEKAQEEAQTKYFDLRNQLNVYSAGGAMADSRLKSDPYMEELREQVEAAKADYDALAKQKDELKNREWFADKSEEYAAITQEAKAAQMPQSYEDAEAEYYDLLNQLNVYSSGGAMAGSRLESDPYLEELREKVENARRALDAFNSHTYRYINDIDGYRDKLSKVNDSRSGMFRSYDFMTEDEIDTYNFLYAYQGKQAAEDYLSYIGKFLNKQEAGRVYQETSEFTDEHPIWANIARVPMNLVSGVGIVDAALQKARNAVTGEYEPIDFYNPAMYPAIGNKAILETTSKNITDAAGTIQLDPEKTPVLASLLNGKGWADVYQLGMSMVDSAAAAGVTMATGIPGTVLLGGSAGTQGMLDALERGADDNQAITMGVLNGAFEALFEYVSLDKLINGDISRSALRQIMEQAFVEGSEEMCTTLANTFAADIPVMGDKSQLMLAMREYREAGLSDAEASRRAWADWGKDFLWDGIGGALSGGIMGGGKMAWNKLTHADYAARYGENAQELVDQALSQDPESKPAQRAQSTLQKGKELSGRQIHSVLQGVQTQDKAAIQKAAQNRLNELGEFWVDTPKLSAALAKQTAGEKLNRAERRVIQFSKYGKRVAAELDPANALSGKYSSDWTGRIGTSRLNTDVYSRAVETAQTPQEAESARNVPVSQETENPAQAVTEDAVEPVSPETSYSVSDSGETTRLSTGETVQIQEVAEAGDGGMKLRMEDGTLVDADDVGYATREDALLYESVADLGADAPAANALIRTYKDYPGDVSVEDYTAGVVEAFRAGQRHIPVSQLAQDPLASKLTDTQRNAAYAAGRNYSRRASEAKEASIKQSAGKTSKTSKSEGKVHFDRKGRTFSKAQETGIKTMEILSKAIGTDFYVYESYEKDGERVYRDENGKEKLAPNGFYDPKTGAIHIDLNAGSGGRGTVLFTLSHELTHFIRQWSPAKFDTLAEAVINTVYDQKNINVKERIQAQQAKAQQTGITLTEDEAYEEVIADSMETILRDGNVLNELMAEIQQKDATLWEKIKQWFQALAEHIRRTIDAYKDYAPDSYEGRAVASMEKYLEALEGYFADALSTAGENYQKATGEYNNTSQKNEVKMQLRSVNGHDVVWIEENILDGNKGIPNHKYIADYIATHIGEVYTIIESGQKVYIGNDLPGEYTQSIYTRAILKRSQSTYRAKNAAAANLGEMIEIATNRRWERTKHSNAKDAKYGFYRYNTRFGFPTKDIGGKAIGANIYNAELLIRNASDGKKYLYDIVKIKKDTASSEWLTKKVTSAAANAAGQTGNVSTSSITTPSEDVKEKFSLRDTAQEDGAKYQANVTETQQFKNWFGDWQKNPRKASKVVNADGTPKIVYHGSPSDFNTFSLKYLGTNGTAEGYGFYFTDSKKVAQSYANGTEAQRHQGANGKLFEVYLDIKKPLSGTQVTMTRSQFRKFLIEMNKQVDEDGEPLDFLSNYGNVAWDGLDNVVNEAMRVEYDGSDSDVNMIHSIINGCGNMETVFEVLRKTTGYDGIIVKDPKWGGDQTVYVAFNSNQVKSATDNIGTFDGSNPDIRYSLRDSVQEKSVKALQDENDRLKEDVSRLKELVKLQGKLTYGKMFSESYIENAARNLKKIADADGKTRELTDLLREMYNSIGNGPDARFDRLEEATKPVVDWLWENKRSYLDPYAETVLDDLKGRKITISKQQAGEIFSSFDSLEAYRKRLSGTVRLVQMGTEGAMDLDSFWQEMADAYPGTFDADISDADMPEALADIVGRLQSMSQKDYEQESPEVQDAMRQELFYEVYQTFWNARITKTVADKKQEEIDLLVEEHEVQMRELKASHAETVSELKAAKETAMKKLREDTKRSQEVRKHRRNIEKKAKKLMDALVKNSDKEHIPEALKGVVGDFLNSIDFSSKSLTKKGTPTKRDISYTEALGRLREVLQKQENLVNGVTDGNLLNDFYMDLPTGFAQAVQEHIEKVTAAAKGLDPSTNQVFAMGAEELQNLDYILTVITRSVSQMNKLLANAHFQTTAEAAQTSILDFKALGKDKDRGKAAGGAYRFLQWHNATPYYVFKRMGEGAQSVFEGLQDGWDRLAFNAQAIIDFAEETYTAKEVKAWTEDVKTVELSSGKKIRLTAAQLMSIYCLSQREQGKRHLFGGGIRIGDFETKQKTGKAQVSDAENYTLTVEDVAMLNGLLSDRQKAVADKLQKYMNTVGTKWGNEVSMKRFGYQAFTEDNYFPIQSDSSNLPTMNTDPQNSSNLYRLLNLSMTKSLNKHANNAAIVNSIFDVFADHMSDMAKYNALALPVLDAMKWYNYKTQAKNGSGQVTSVAVKQSMESAFGKSANNYFMNLIKDINGTNEGGKGTDRLTRKMISNYKVAAVAGNLRVALLQPTAYVRATAVLNPKYLTRGLAVNPVKAAQEAEKYSGIAAWKSMGFYDTGIARGIREQIKHDTGIKDALVEKSMKAAEWGDRLTWGVLWNACKLEVQETQHLSGEALLEATSKRFRDVVYRTQVVDSTMTRSQSMRDTTGLSVYTTAFMAEPTLSYNMLLDVYSDYTNEVRRTSDKGAAWGKVKNAFIRTLVSYTLTNLAAALAEGFIDGLRDDDEYEAFLEKFLEHFKDNFWDDMNPLTKLPVIKEILSFLEDYDNGRMDTEWAKNLVYAYNIWAETVALKTGAQEKATSITYNGKMTLYGKLYNTLKAMSQAVGMPFSNTMREAASLWNNTLGVITGKKLRTYDPGPASQIKYAYLNGYLTQEEATQELLKLDPEEGGAKDADDAYFKIQRWETDKGRYAALDTALQQDQSIDAAVKDLTSHGIKPEEIQCHIKSTVGGWYKDSAISREEAISMLKKNTDLDSTAAVAKWDWDIQYPEYVDLSEAAVSRYASSGVSAKVYYDACKFVASATGDKDADGNTISGSKKEKVMKYIASLNISDSQKDSLWNAIKGNWKGSWR